MKARAIVLLERDGADLARWIIAAAIVLAAHLGLVATYLTFFMQKPPGAPVTPALILDLAPMPVAPASRLDMAPGPEMVEAQPPEPQVIKPPMPEPVVEPPPQVLELPPPEPVVEPPPVEKPVVALPEPPPLPPLPQVKREEPKPEEKPPEPKRVEPKKQIAPRTTAPPRSERNVAERPASPSAGASAAAVATWRDQVFSQLQRAKRYPSGAQSRREHGVVTLSFTLGRNGAVLARNIARGSGYAELDQEVLAMVLRAQPFPPFPEDMKQARFTFTAPIQFSAR